MVAYHLAKYNTSLMANGRKTLEGRVKKEIRIVREASDDRIMWDVIETERAAQY